MASFPRKRPKPETLSPRPKPHKTSQSSSVNSFFLMEPPPGLFPSKEELPRLVAVVVIAVSVAAICNFVAISLNRQPKPFCDSDLVFDYSFSDACEHCPQHGVCRGGKLECLHGYKKHGKLCVEDTDINEKAKELSNYLETHVCEAYAQHLCYGIDTIWVRVADLWNTLDELKLKEKYGLDEAKYMHAKRKAVDIAGQVLEKRTNDLGTKELKCTDLLVEHYKPVSCIVRQWIAKHALILVPVLALLVGCTFLLLKFRRWQTLSVRAEQLYNNVCDMLEENALTARGVDGGHEPWLVAAWLRDHLLLPKERKDPLLWKKVEELAQGDSRLGRYPRMVKGEAKVVWEWQVDGSLSSSGKRKGEESKLYSSGGINLSSRRPGLALKSDPAIQC